MTLHVVVIGGGASGVLFAVHLLRSGPPDARVTLIERQAHLGQGVAYSARQQDHVLNVPATGMSAFADDPDHFRRWLCERGLIAETERFVFVPRRHYGAYLASVFETTRLSGRINVVSDTAVDLRTGPAGVEVILASGASVVGHLGVLAVGHEINPARSRGIAVRVGSEADTPLEPDAPVLILGSGLSMVDAWLSLAHAQHRGHITVVSRHGLLPQSHRQVGKMELDAADVPFGTDLHYFQRWFRETVDEVVERGGDWRSVVDALRPFNQRIWQNWSQQSRRRFLSHVRPFWNVHRHRLPPDLYERLREAIGSGQVRLLAGELISLAQDGTKVLATVRAKRTNERETLAVARAYDCGGVTVDVEASSNPLVRALVARGEARADALHIGLDVTRGCEVIDATGTPSRRLYAVGPLTRGTYFEIEAIPDIRLQVEALAQAMAIKSAPSLPAAGSTIGTA